MVTGPAAGVPRGGHRTIAAATTRAGLTVRAMLDQNAYEKGVKIALHRQGRFPYDRLIQAFPLEAVNDALEASRSGEVVKPVLRMPA